MPHQMWAPVVSYTAAHKWNYYLQTGFDIQQGHSYIPNIYQLLFNTALTQ
jgi:hypothetical protein